ncbi:hypothetical protein MY11210_009658 [Beauveria gryllotalpidicola]
MFNFTEPTANLTGLNIMEYFAPIDPGSAIDRALAEQDKAEKDEAEQKVSARFKRDKESSCLAETTINTVETSDFNSYLKAMGIEASAAVSGYGQEATVSGSYLDRAEMMRSTLTYLTVVTVDHQVQLPGDYSFNLEDYDNETFAENYGNRWIRAEATLREVKSKVNAFLAVACEHKYKYRPLIERYEHLADFPPQKVKSYHQAEAISQIVLEELIRCSEIKMVLEHAKHISREIKQAIKFDYADITHEAREWTKATAKDPSNPRELGQKLLDLLNKNFINKYYELFQPQDYISGLTVQYGWKWPAEYVREVNDRGYELNKGFGGTNSDSFFVITTTRDPERACSSFKLMLSYTDMSRQDPEKYSADISKGTRDKWYRHIVCVRAGEEGSKKITKVALLRGENNYEDYISKAENGFIGGGGSDNLNKNRGTQSDSLFLIWGY